VAAGPVVLVGGLDLFRYQTPEKPDLLNQAIGLRQSGTTLDMVAKEGNLLGRDILLERLCLTPRSPLLPEPAYRATDLAL
jgi:hypothetical protein